MMTLKPLWDTILTILYLLTYYTYYIVSIKGGHGLFIFDDFKTPAGYLHTYIWESICHYGPGIYALMAYAQPCPYDCLPA